MPSIMIVLGWSLIALASLAVCYGAGFYLGRTHERERRAARTRPAAPSEVDDSVLDEHISPSPRKTWQP
jgi:hypothetical protein